MDEAPRDGTVIVVHDGERAMAAAYTPAPENGAWQWSTFDPGVKPGLVNGYQERFLLGWMPLPEPPKGR